MPGTITTGPDEIDEIIRNKYGEIYNGNVKNNENHVKESCEKYSNFIFRRPQADIEKIIGQDVYEVLQEQKETAGGVGQWTPASL